MDSFIFLLLVGCSRCGMSTEFFITNATYTWQEAVDNPPCHMVGMTQESRDTFALLNLKSQVIINMLY